MKPKVDELRREPEVELKTFTLSLPVETVELLESYGVKSGRGGGNLSAFCEVALELTIGIFDNPELATESLLRILGFSDLEHYNISSNLEEIAKRLLDSIE